MKGQRGEVDLAIIGLGVLVILSAVLLFLMYRATVEDAAAWSQFSEENDCSVIETIPGTSAVTTIISSDGKSAVAVTSTPTKNRWFCRADESSHWR